MNGIYCLMNSGEPLDETICDVLLFNAYDMYHENRRVQRIKSRSYDGIIESNLEVIEFNEIAVVKFLANISTDIYQSNEVQFVVRVEDFEKIPVGEWVQLKLRVAPICSCEECQSQRRECGCENCQIEMQIIEDQESTFEEM